jgi:hypothetical protein
MRRVTIALPDSLYAELREVSAAAGEPGYGPARWAGEIVASELAARRLPRMVQGRNGARITADKPTEPVTYHVRLPEIEGMD